MQRIHLTNFKKYCIALFHVNHKCLFLHILTKIRNVNKLCIIQRKQQFFPLTSKKKTHRSEPLLKLRFRILTKNKITDVRTQFMNIIFTKINHMSTLVPFPEYTITRKPCMIHCVPCISKFST